MMGCRDVLSIQTGRPSVVPSHFYMVVHDSGLLVKSGGTYKICFSVKVDASKIAQVSVSIFIDGILQNSHSCNRSVHFLAFLRK